MWIALYSFKQAVLLSVLIKLFIEEHFRRHFHFPKVCCIANANLHLKKKQTKNLTSWKTWLAPPKNLWYVLSLLSPFYSSQKPNCSAWKGDHQKKNGISSFFSLLYDVYRMCIFLDECASFFFNCKEPV